MSPETALQDEHICASSLGGCFEAQKQNTKICVPGVVSDNGMLSGEKLQLEGDGPVMQKFLEEKSPRSCSQYTNPRTISETIIERCYETLSQ